MALRKQLDTPYQITFTVTAVKVNSIAVDAENSLIHLGHSLLASDGSVIQADRLETLDGQAYTNYNTRKNELGELFLLLMPPLMLPWNICLVKGRLLAILNNLIRHTMWTIPVTCSRLNHSRITPMMEMY